MKSYVFTFSTPAGTEKIDVCRSCHDKLGLPEEASSRNVRISGKKSRLYREDKCAGCGENASSGFSSDTDASFDGDGVIVSRRVTPRNGDALAQLINLADGLEGVLATTDAPTEEEVVGESERGKAYAKIVRQAGETTGIHLLVRNGPMYEHGREEMEERCRKLKRLLQLNGWEGAERPKDAPEEYPDWEIWAVRSDE